MTKQAVYRAAACIIAGASCVYPCMSVLTENNSSSQRGKVWFITGASSGFGRLLAEYLVTLGASVVATARKPDVLKDLELSAPELVMVHGLDVTSTSSIQSAVDDAIARFGHVDVLVNNAGYGLTAALEEATAEEYAPMFDTNVFGLVNMTKALLPQFRERRKGNIVMLSSVGGIVGLPGWGYYNATKFAVEGLSEALATEMGPLGVHVTLIEPGPFRTEFLGTSGKASKAVIADYAETAGKTRKYMETQTGKQAGDPQKAVEAIVAAVSAAEPPLHLPLGKLALDRFDKKYKDFQRDIDVWKDTILGADFPEA
jgi:NAD(P)-dependent dehydrogenase (short-subunit alcohol dehydrogenase family)